MRGFRRVAACFMVLSAGAAESASLSPTALFNRASASVVVVQAVDARQEPASFGSGVVVAPNVVATNAHVIADAHTIEVRQGEVRWPATVMHFDEDRDLALLRVRNLRLPIPKVRAVARVPVGTRIFAIGSPRGLEATLSEGLVAGIRGEEGERVLQITAAISPGSSGGGVFDAQGRLVGLSTGYLQDSQNLNFAIPTDWIAEALSKPSTPLRLAKAPKSPAGDETQETASSPARASTPAERCLGALNAYLGDRAQGKPAPGTAWLNAQKGWVLMTFASELHADARGNRRDLFACQDAGIGAEELRLFHLVSSGLITEEEVIVPPICVATFELLMDELKGLPPRVRASFGYHLGFRAGVVNLQLRKLFPEAESIAPTELPQIVEHLTEALKREPENKQQSIAEEALLRCDRVEIPLRQVLGLLGHRLGDDAAWDHGTKNAPGTSAD
jgi:hypothetical protein